MKKIFLGMYFFAILLVSTVSIGQTQTLEPVREFYVIYMDWDGWGRTSRDCRGFGLCNFTSCTFCCIENGVIVSCNNSNRIPNSGVANIDKKTNKGFLTIKLDPIFSDQKDAISNRETLHIDIDLTKDGFTLHKGEYAFDSSMGKHGGYNVKVTKN